MMIIHSCASGNAGLPSYNTVAHNLTEDHEDDEEPESNKKKRPNSDPGLGQQKITKYTDYCDSVS